MQRRRFLTILMIFWAGVIGAGAVNAQGAHRFEVNIPFPFLLRDRVFPAGEYRIERIDQTKPDLLMLKNTNDHLTRLVLTQRVEHESPSTATYLLFKRKEGKLYLFQIWITGAINGLQIPSLDEKEKRNRGTEGTSLVRLNAKTAKSSKSQ